MKPSFRSILVVAAAIGAAGVALAQSAERPRIVPGDSWVYRDTEEVAPSRWTQTRDEVLVNRVSSSTIYFTTREVGSPNNVKERLSTLEWGRSRDVNGAEMVVNQPLAFPLAPGKTWEINYTENDPPSNKAHKWEKWSGKYVVVGSETIEVPAGKFNAIKVECEGHWSAELAPAMRTTQTADANSGGVSSQSSIMRVAPRVVSGRFYRAYWYVPEVKRLVKNVEEYYDANGIRSSRYTGELESYKLAG